MDLAEEQWSLIRPFIPDPEVVGSSEKGGRPWRDPRDVLNGIFWVLLTGAPWADLPRRYPPPQTKARSGRRTEQAG
jgi:transposase